MFFLLKYQVITYYNRLKANWKLYREQSRYWKLRRKSVATLKRIDNREIPTNQDEIRLFVHIRNESLRLPYFIEYYQKLGVNRFFFIDNDSTDDSLQLALAVGNGHVFSTKDEFKNHHYWREHFLDRYGKGHWCVVVDVDELLFYPHIERVSLKGLCSFLESRQTTAIRALFLDLYADTSVTETIYRQGENPLDVIRFFDSSYQKIPYWFEDRPKAISYFFEVFTGGMRSRVFGHDPPPILSKVPLLKYKEGTYLTQGMHAINCATLSDLQAVVLHTKFLSDFIEKVEEECQREQYYGNAFRYKIYQRKIKVAPDIQLYCSDSIEIKDSEQLVELGLLKTTLAFEAFVESALLKKQI